MLNKIKGIRRGKAVLLPVLIFNCIFFAACILHAPGFSSDDFYIFALVSKNPLHPVSINFQEIFFLFLRPVSYFSFWFTYHLFYDNALLMKFFSLLLHLGVIFIIWRLLNDLSLFTGKGRDYLLAGLLLLLFSVHPDTVMYILHINNRTELLMLLFYSAALWVALCFLRGELSSRMFLLSAALMYILSILSKQNGMHYPLLLLFPLFFMDIPADRKKVLIPAALVLTFVMVVFSYINIYSIGIPDNAGTLNKPFTAAGILLFTTVPLIAEEVYSWFLHNKNYAIMGSVVIIAATVSLLTLVPAGKRKGGVAVLLLILVLLYPRIFSLGGGRINSHLVLWMILFIYYFLSDKIFKYKYLIPVVLIIMNFIYSVKMVDKITDNNNFRKEQSFELQQLIGQSGNTLVALSGMAASLYEYNYYTAGKFGEPDIQGNALVSKYIFPGREKVEKVISCQVSDDEIIFYSSAQDVFIGEHPLNRITKKYDVSAKGELTREYRSFALKIPDSINFVTFHNGKNWESVSL